MFGFEPTDFAHKKLLTNINLNKNLSERIVVNKILVSDKELTIENSDIKSSYNINNRQTLNENPVRFDVTCIDNYIFNLDLKNLDIIKIDVDGYEFKILRGALNTITKFKPIIYIELDQAFLSIQNDSVYDILNYFENIGYKGYLANSTNIQIKVDNINDIYKKNSHFNVIYTYNMR